MAKAKVTPPIDNSVLGGGVSNKTQKEKRDVEGKIAELLNKIGIDKVLHFLVFAWVVAIGLAYSFTTGIWCFIGMLVLSLIKELVIDKKIGWLDLIVGIVGGIVSFALYIPKDWLL